MTELQHYTSQFYATKQDQGRSSETLRHYRFHIDRFLAWCNQQDYHGNDFFGVAGAEIIEEYLAHLRASGMSLFTVHGVFRSLRAFYKWLFKRYALGDLECPFTYVSEPTKPDLLPKAIGYAQYCVLLNSISPTPHYPTWLYLRDRLLVRMLFETGARSREVLRLRLGDVDLERRSLRVLRSKIHKEDLIPFSRSLQTELGAWFERRPLCAHDSLWPSYLHPDKQANLSLTYDGLRCMLRDRCRAAKLPSFAPHAFRHGCGVHIVQRGGDISLVQKILGHRQLSTTTVYLRFDSDQLRGLYDRIFD